MRILRSRAVPSAADESPPKKPHQSPHTDPSTPVRDEVIATPPSLSSVPTPDSGGPRSAASLPHPRRSLRLASEVRSEGAVEGLQLPQESSACEDEGAGEGSSVADVEKVEELKLRSQGGGRDRKDRGKRKVEIDASFVGSAGVLSLRSGKSVAKSIVDSGAARDLADSSVNVIEFGGSEGVGLNQGGGVAADDMDSREEGSRSVEIPLSRSRKLLRHQDKGKDKLDEEEVIDLDSNANGSELGVVVGRRRYGAEEKGKGKMVKDNNSPTGGKDVMDLDSEFNQSGQRSEGLDQESENMVQTRSKKSRGKTAGESSAVDVRGRFRDIARRNASRFAHFNPDDEVGSLPVQLETNVNVAPRRADPEPEDWPGPFSTAMKIIMDRAARISTRQSNSSLSKCKAAISWVPKTSTRTQMKRPVPSLVQLCLNILSANADAITSLDGVPDLPRHKLSQSLCDSRKMNKHFFNLLVAGSPNEIRIKDSSWLTEEELTESFRECDTSNLTVLQLDQCGRCLPDYVISSSISRSSNCLPALSTISITGACRLTDDGLATLISSAPALRSINISQCSLLTGRSIETLANSLGSVLKELYINDCQSIDATLILPALKKLEHLQVLSVAGISSVSDGFVREFVTLRGHTIRELILSDCTDLTDASLKAIAEACPGLLALNLVNLTKLTDSTLGYLSNGCKAIEKLFLCRNTFSDEAIAAFLETSGELEELSLNNVKKVGPNTAISLSKRTGKLRSLDLSWCRNITDEALGLIVDSCSCLRELRVFGCTQITDTFLNGHSNPEVKIVGLKMAPFLEHCRVALPQYPLKYP